MMTYVEISRSEHNHGGPGWEFGRCLWSPARNRSGADRYSLMREPQVGDRLIHIYRTEHAGLLDTYVLGQSFVQKTFEERTDEPPSPGDWAGMDTYYRIELMRYQNFLPPMSVSTLLSEYGDEIWEDLKTNGPRFYPFTTHGQSIRTVQGIYLARATLGLISILEKALRIGSGNVEAGGNLHSMYFEGKRLLREQYFFFRNPLLAMKAKQRDGYCCTACGFRFADKYTEIGNGFIEAHHINPLSERPEEEWSHDLLTSLDDVVSLCSNCHKMIHRRKPAFTLSQLKRYLGE